MSSITYLLPIVIGIIALFGQFLAAEIPARHVPAMIRHTLLKLGCAMDKNAGGMNKLRTMSVDFYLMNLHTNKQKIKQALETLDTIETVFNSSELPNETLAWSMAHKLKLFGGTALKVQLTLIESDKTERYISGDPLAVELHICLQQEAAPEPCLMLREIKDHIEAELLKDGILIKLQKTADRTPMGGPWGGSGGWEYRDIAREVRELHTVLLYAQIYRKLLNALQNQEAPNMEFEMEWLKMMAKTLEDKYHEDKAKVGTKFVWDVGRFVDVHVKPHFARCDQMIGDEKGVDDRGNQ